MVGGFVEQQHVRLSNQGAGERNALEATTRQCAHLRLRVETKPAQHLLDPLVQKRQPSTASSSCCGVSRRASDSADEEAATAISARGSPFEQPGGIAQSVRDGFRTRRASSANRPPAVGKPAARLAPKHPVVEVPPGRREPSASSTSCCHCGDQREPFAGAELEFGVIQESNMAKGQTGLVERSEGIGGGRSYKPSFLPAPRERLIPIWPRCPQTATIHAACSVVQWIERAPPKR